MVRAKKKNLTKKKINIEFIDQKTWFLRYSNWETFNGDFGTEIAKTTNTPTFV